MTKLIVAVLAVLLLAPFGEAQRAGSQRMQGPRTSITRQQQGLGNTSDPLGHRIRATSPQQKQFRQWTQSTRQLRHRVRDTVRAARGASIAKERALALCELLRAELQAMLQEQEKFLASLDTAQSTAEQEHTQGLQGNVQQLEEWFDLLELELELEEIDTARVREKAQSVDEILKRIEEEQRRMETDLTIEP